MLIGTACTCYAIFCNGYLNIYIKAIIIYLKIQTFPVRFYGSSGIL